MILNSRV